MVSRLLLLFPTLLAAIGAENMVCSKFGYNWAAEIRCLRALLSQCTRSPNVREARKVLHHWNEHPNNFISIDGRAIHFPMTQPTSTISSTTTSPLPTRELPDIEQLTSNLTENFEKKLRDLKEALQTEVLEKIVDLQARFENDLEIYESRTDRKVNDLRRKHEVEVRKLTKSLELLGARIHRYNNNEYIFMQARKSWYEAEEDCIVWGGHLVSIKDEKENAFVQGILRAASAWIGVNDVQVENIFVNSDQTPVNYRNFAEGEPDNASHNENCVEIKASGKWADAFCLVTKPFICKR
ncbi:unnamed protein product [Cylicocyclus nassatus]|uniref:C-type lectin domain-containing protein n=1 Tax=Cylicocyclus nassatus TaxID=53992 RepID=A0AA36GQY5_CYLNA|nr:unnamed protein product [Cylicocyclus nassatus]